MISAHGAGRSDAGDDNDLDDVDGDGASMQGREIEKGAMIGRFRDWYS